MNELIINYSTSKNKRLFVGIVSLYLTLFCLYFVFTEGTNNRFDFLFFTALVGMLLALILFLSCTLWASKYLLFIGSNLVDSNMPSSSFKIEWTSVSRVNIGVSYIIFLIDGGRKQRKLDLSGLMYNDVSFVKSKVIELAEHKSIPYIND